MVKSMYAFVREAWKVPEKSGVKALLWNRMQEWRREGSVVRLERPTRIDRARYLGYKAKQGIAVARVQVRRGGRRVSRYVRARRSARMGKNHSTPGKSIQRIAEERASKKFPNMEVLNSYWVGQDGKLKYYEVILVDGHHPSIRADRNLAWLAESTHRGRAERGKTSAGRKGRGMGYTRERVQRRPVRVSVPMRTRANNLILFLRNVTFMKITDACVYPYPCGDSSVRRMALEARSLGFDRLVAAGVSSGEHFGIEVLHGCHYQRYHDERSHQPGEAGEEQKCSRIRAGRG